MARRARRRTLAFMKLTPLALPFFATLLTITQGCSPAAGLPREGDASDDAASDGAALGDAGADANAPETSSCDPSNCKGCCQAGVCQIGDVSFACGIGGGTCATCTGNHVACLTTRTCGYHPDVAWHVTVESAAINATNGTADWDVGGGAPDPFVRLWCSPSASTPKTSTTIVDSLAPKWPLGADCFIPYKDLASTGFAIELLDDDVAVNDTIVAKTTVIAKPADFTSGSMKVSNSVATITLRLE